jgi:2,4-dienoyl-CoA reductase-like NADH-dependent reductase (Old Yellow Enzyme family)
LIASPVTRITSPETEGEDWSEPQELARRLRDAGCSLLNVSAGNPYYNPHYTRPFDQPAAGQRYPDEHPLVGVGRLRRGAAAVQKAVPDVPVVGSGYSWLRQYVPHAAAAATQAGDATLIGLGRGALAYPDCVEDLSAHGVFDERKVCTTCSGCTQLMRDGNPVGCVVRDSDNYGAQAQPDRGRASRVDEQAEQR